jgi:hypothetical protein
MENEIMQEPPSSLTKDQSTQKENPIIVKFIAKGLPREFNDKSRYSRQLPGHNSQWGKCRFLFDPYAQEYDWLVVYQDLPRELTSQSVEKLHCPREKTILITGEPSSITVYGSYYLRQFGFIITSQEPWAIKHPNAIFTQPGLIWYYGSPRIRDKSHRLTYDEIQQIPPIAKTKTISTMCSSRKGRLTAHYKRYHFTNKLKARIPELDIFGHGVKTINDKAEALDSYRYHVTVENHVYRHHITEKLPDAFLGYTLPFYHGCPNAKDYFPSESFIPIDINDLDRTVDIIRFTLANNEYKDRLPFIIEARKRVLEKYNLFAVLEREITKRDSTIKTSHPGGEIMCRQTLKFRKPIYGLQREFEKIFTKIKHIRW